ncbi:thioredoxin family protein [Chitinophagaceae bacterium 26-R-25]|nr:thioredoxin family protein [Chitinophagaceae bacterium 26-R-25]
MKFLALLLLSSITVIDLSWQTDFEKAKQTAHEKHHLILLNFSGSDWCGPCIRLHKEIFDSDGFKKVADEQLELVNADFPRLRKNQLSKEQQQQNDKLADRYNAQGNFPATILLDADGKVIKEWDGYPSHGITVFIDELNTAIHAANQ